MLKISIPRFSNVQNRMVIKRSLKSGSEKRLEIAVSLAQLRELVPQLRLAQQPSYQPFFVIRGLTGLLVRMRPN